MVIGSGELARRAGVSPDTLRHYERVGVLTRPPRSANNYRVYPETALARVLLVRRALAFGFSLAELALILRERDKGGRPCRKVRQIAAAKLASAETRLVELTRLRDELRLLLDQWDRKLDSAPAGQAARLLESLPYPPDPSPAKDHTHESIRPDPRPVSHPLSGHWRHESTGKRTPPSGRSRR
jgi:DNA-binding transcriptional MerR regulator